MRMARASGMDLMTHDETVPASVGIVADDLTGANDSAVQFARAGWIARLALGDIANVGGAGATGRRDSGSVVAIVTDARAQSPRDAHESTVAAVAALADSGVGRLFVKIDSTMRGSVAQQVAGALEGWQDVHPLAFAVVCPAYPAMGRTVEGGRLLVDGAPVETTSIGRDPVTPVATSSLSALLPGTTRITAAPKDAAALAARITGRAEAGALVITVDAETGDDLALIADAIALIGPRAVPVGSAGLAVEMSRVWGEGLAAPEPEVATPDGPRRVVVVVSSLHDVSRGQHAHLVESSASGLLLESVQTIAPSLDELLNDGLPGFLDQEFAAFTDAEPAPVIVVLAPAQRPVDEEQPGASAVRPTAAERIAAGLATITDQVIGRLGTGSLVLMGGEGARAVLARFGADSILVRDAIREGIPIGIIEGGRLHGLPVVTKAGGFGARSVLTEIVPDLLNDYALNPTQGDNA